MRIASRAVTVAVVGICAVLLLSASVSAFALALDVVLVTDKPAYRVGDFVNATVYVINGGVLADADSASLAVSSFGSWIPLENVSLSHEATGTYRGVFRITANLTLPVAVGVTLRAQASVGYVTDSASVDLYAPSWPDLQARLSLSSSEAVPGQTVHGTLTVTSNGQPRDADSVNVSIWFFLPFQGEQVANPQVTNLSTGLYAFSYTVPGFLTQPVSILVTGMATIRQGNSSFSYADQTNLLVTFPDPFLIWYNATEWTPRSVLLTVGVAGPTGSPIMGATVTVYPPLNLSRVPLVPTVLNGTSDASGLSSFNITLYSPGYLTFWGYATQGTANQTFGGEVESLAPVNRSMAGFELRRNNPLDVFQPGETAVLNYTASNDGIALNATRLYYDVHDTTSLLAYGNVTTSASGGFTLRFPMVSDTATVDLSGQMSSNVWASTFDSVQPGMRLDAHAGPFEVGATTHIVASLPAGEAPWHVTVGFYPYAESAYPDFRQEWCQLPDGAGVLPGVDAEVRNSSELSVNLTIPSFLPSNQDYYLEITAQPTNPGTSPGIPYVLKEVVYVGAQPAPPIDPLLVLSLVALAGVLGVAAIVLLVLRRRPRQPASVPLDGGPRVTAEEPAKGKH